MAIYAEGVFSQLEEKGCMQKSVEQQKNPSGETSNTRSPQIFFEYAWYSVLLVYMKVFCYQESDRVDVREQMWHSLLKWLFQTK